MNVWNGFTGHTSLLLFRCRSGLTLRIFINYIGALVLEIIRQFVNGVLGDYWQLCCASALATRDFARSTYVTNNVHRLALLYVSDLRAYGGK